MVSISAIGLWFDYKLGVEFWKQQHELDSFYFIHLFIYIFFQLVSL